MATISMRVDDEFKEKFKIEWESKGYDNESDYVKEIINARHEILFLKQLEGVILVMNHEELNRIENLSKLRGLPVNDFIISILNKIKFDSEGNPYCDTSFSEKSVNTGKDSDLQVFTSVNGGETSGVNGCLQENLHKTSNSVNIDFISLLNDFKKETSEHLLSFDFIEIILERLEKVEQCDVFEELKQFKQLLANAENLLKYYYQNTALELTSYNILRLNLILYQSINPEQVKNIEAFCSLLK